MQSQRIKYHTCPHCKKDATVLVEIENDARFYRDAMGNIQYCCTHCYLTFSIRNTRNIIMLKPGC